MMLRNLILALCLCLPLAAAENIKAVGAVAKANIKAIGAVAEANIKAFGPVDNTGGGGTGGGTGVPTFVESVVGTAVQTTTLTLTLPTHQADDILIAVVGDGDGQTITCNTAGWAEIATQVTDSATVTASFWWKRAASGSETNPEFAVGSSADVFFGAVSGFRGCVASGTPFEDATTVAVASVTTPQTAAITTTGVDRLVVALMAQDNNLTPWNGHPTTGWSNAYPTADTSTSVGADMRLACQYIGQATAATVAAVTIGTLNGPEESGQVTFALIPD